MSSAPQISGQGAPQYSASDFALALQDHLPTGAAWPRDPDAVQSQFCLALMQQYERLHMRSINLLSDAFPVQPVELLPEWQSTLGLPDPCAGPSPVLAVEQQQVAARFIGTGGQSISYYETVATALGYEITITQYSPSRFGRYFGLTFAGSEWSLVWTVTAPTGAADQVLQCELERIAPAHTYPMFTFLPPSLAFDLSRVLNVSVAASIF